MKGIGASVLGMMAITVVHGQPARFELLPVLSSEYPATAPTGLSEAGDVVVGHSADTDSFFTAFRSTTEGGIQGLGRLEPPNDSYANGVSSDGSIVVGYSYTAQARKAAFRWSESTGMVPLGQLPGGLWSEAIDASGDGQIIVGDSDTPDSHQGFKWTASTGMTPLPLLDSSFPRGSAEAISADGKVVVGWSTNADGDHEAVYWDDNDEVHPLGFLSRGSRSTARAVSNDGAVIAGDGHGFGDQQGFRWTADGGMQGLGIIPGTSWNAVEGMTSDGSVIVGRAYLNQFLSVAFIWDEQNGIRDLRRVLIDEYGLAELENWAIGIAGDVSISGDGLTLTGVGFGPDQNYHGWVVRIPEPGSLVGISLIALLVVANRRQRF